jgi:ankyrin repeat protein
LECKIKRRVAAGNKVIEEVLSNMDRFVQKDDIDFDLETGLHKAVGTGALSHIRPLLAAGADINGRPTCLIGDLSDVVSDSDEKFGGWNLSFGRYHEPPPPLVLACEILKRHEDIAQFGGDEEGESAVPPLTVAKAMVELLLLSNADPNLRAVDGEGVVLTALIVSSFVTNQSDIVTALLERGADINAKDEGDFTALMVATHGGYQNIGTVTALLERGADVHAVGQRNMVHECPTALKLAKTWNS